MHRTLGYFLVLLTLFASQLLVAKGEKGIRILKDDEIENMLHDLARPIFSAAKIKDHEIEFVLLDDVQENAFVIGGKVIFVNSGLLINNISNPEAITGVIAHELGHLLAKHNIIKQIHLADANKNIMYGSILGLAAMTAGIPELGTFLSVGAYNSGFLTMMKYSRQHESEADKISSNLLTKAGVGTNGLLKFLNSLRERERQISFNPYYLTHPLTKDRIAFLRNYTNVHKFYSDSFISLYQRAIYKLMAFTTNRVNLYTANIIPNQTNRDYANSIILFRLGKLAQATEILDKLLISDELNPYFLELRAQIKLSKGKFSDAIEDFAKAYSMNNRNGLIANEYAFAIIKFIEQNPSPTKKHEYLNKIIEILKINLSYSEDDILTLTLLANAYFLNGMEGESKLILAEKFYILGENDKAKIEVEKAIKLLKPKTADYLKAQDLKSLL